MWCVWSRAIQTPSIFCFSIQCLNYKRLANSHLYIICNVLSLILHSGPYTRMFTTCIKFSSEHHKWLFFGKTKQQKCLNCCVHVVSKSVFPLLCGHFWAWFGYACKVQRVEKNSLSNECDGPACMVTHTPSFFFGKMHFHHGHCFNHNPIKDAKYGIWTDLINVSTNAFILLNVLACHAWRESAKLNYCAWLHGRNIPFNVFILLRALRIFQKRIKFRNVLVLEWAKDTLG